jgi:hypothetical protein
MLWRIDGGEPDVGTRETKGRKKSGAEPEEVRGEKSGIRVD